MVSAKDFIKFYEDNPYASLEQAAKRFNISKNNVKTKRAKLTARGLLKKQDPNQRYQHTALNTECDNVGIPTEDVNHYWYKGEHFSIHVNNKKINLWDLKEQIIEDMKKYSPKYPIIKYPKIKDSHLLVIDPADIHVGKLCAAFETGETYNHEIAINRVKDGVLGILQKAQPYNIEKILFIIGNDILHTDNAKHHTTLHFKIAI